MVISVFQGFININLKDTGLTFMPPPSQPIFATWQFSQSSNGPLHNYGSLTSIPQGGQSVVSDVVSVLPAVGGFSELLLTGGSGTGGGSQISWIDDYCYMLGGQYTTTGIGTFIHILKKFQGRPPGNYDANNNWSQSVFLSPFDTSILTGICPANSVGVKMTGFGYNAQDLNMRVGLMDQFGNISAAITPSNMRAPASGSQYVTNRINLIDRITNPSGFDNCLFVATNQNDPVTANALRLLWTMNFGSTTASYQLDTINLDNSSLDAQFQSSGYPQLYYGGFIYTIPTGGSGPTGQKCETLIFTGDMSKYFIVVYTPLDSQSSAQLSGSGFWQTQIDTDGIFWFNNNEPTFSTKLSYSFQAGPGIPLIQPPPLEPIVLPCFATCSPVPLVNH